MSKTVEQQGQWCKRNLTLTTGMQNLGVCSLRGVLAVLTLTHIQTNTPVVVQCAEHGVGVISVLGK